MNEPSLIWLHGEINRRNFPYENISGKEIAMMYEGYKGMGKIEVLTLSILWIDLRACELIPWPFPKYSCKAANED